MQIVYVVLGILLFTYSGYAIGLAAYCAQVPSLQHARKVAWYIPLFILTFPIFVLTAKDLENRFKHIWNFLRLPDKGLCFAVIFENVLAKEDGKAYNYQMRKPRTDFSFAKTVLTMTNYTLSCQ